MYLFNSENFCFNISIFLFYFISPIILFILFESIASSAFLCCIQSKMKTKKWQMSVFRIFQFIIMLIMQFVMKSNTVSQIIYKVE